MEDKKYIVNLKDIVADNINFEYQLDDAYFQALGNNDIRGGNVYMKVSVHKLNDFFVVRFIFDGNVAVLCDRCLDDMQQQVNGNEKFEVKFGTEYQDDGDNLIIISEEEGTIDLSPIMNELIVLAIPLKHEHVEGKCNKEMMKKLEEYFVTSEDVESNNHQGNTIKSILDNN